MDVAAACCRRAGRVVRVRAIGARIAGVEPFTRFAPVAESRSLGGDEANASFILIAAKREIIAGPTCASHTLTVQARLTNIAGDRLKDAP